MTPTRRTIIAGATALGLAAAIGSTTMAKSASATMQNKTALPLVVLLIAKPGREKALHDELVALVAPTRAEDGCEQYDLFADQQTVGQFVLVERWTSRELWDRHMHSPHLKRFGEISSDLVSEWKLMQLTPIP